MGHTTYVPRPSFLSTPVLRAVFCLLSLTGGQLQSPGCDYPFFRLDEGFNALSKSGPSVHLVRDNRTIGVPLIRTFTHRSALIAKLLSKGSLFAKNCESVLS